MRRFCSPAWIAACAAALLVSPLWAGRRAAPPAPAWMDPVPANARAPLLTAMKRLVTAEFHQDWETVYELRPELDQETESETEFVRRWNETEPATVLDFEPLRADYSTFAGTSQDEQVFDILGCAQVKSDHGPIGQEGSVSAHWEGGEWSLDGIHLLTNDDDQPEACAFHADRALLAAAVHRRH